MRGLAYVIGALLAAAFPSSAAATTDTPVPGGLIAGPVLVGESAVAVDGGPSGTRAIRAYAEGQPPQSLPAFDPLLGDRGEFTIAGSATRVAIGREGRRGATAALLSAPLNGPGTLLARCPDAQNWDPLLASGDLLLFSGPGDAECRSHTAFQARDLSSQPPARLTVPQAAPADFSWPYVARVELKRDAHDDFVRGDVVVYDLRAAAEAYRVRVPDEPRVTVDADGTLVVANRSSNGKPCTVFWASAADPTPHRLSEPTCPGSLRLRAGRLIEARYRRDGSVFLTARDLPDGAPVPVSDRIPNAVGFPADYDGERIAFGAHDCLGADRVVVDDVADAMVRGPYSLGSCTAAVRVRSRPLGRHGRMPVRLTCPSGCIGEFLVLRGHHSFNGGSLDSFAVPAGRTRSFTVHIDEDELPRIARRGSIAAEVVALVRQPGEQPARFGVAVKLRRRNTSSE